MSLKYDCATCPTKSANCAFGRMRNSTSCLQLIEQYELAQRDNCILKIERLLKETKEVRNELHSIANNDIVQHLTVAINSFHVALNQEEEEL